MNYKQLKALAEWLPDDVMICGSELKHQIEQVEDSFFWMHSFPDWTISPEGQSVIMDRLDSRKVQYDFVYVDEGEYFIAMNAGIEYAVTGKTRQEALILAVLGMIGTKNV